MYYLTENTIEMEGRTLTQIKKILDGKEIYGGYIDKELVHHPDVWVDKNSYLINTTVRGKVIVGRNVIIRNSTIINNCYIKNNCEINNCYIAAPPNKGNHFEPGIKLNNQTIIGISEFGPKICNDGDFENDMFNGVCLNMTKHYCKVGCITFTYQQAKEILDSDELWEEFKQRYGDEPNVFESSTKMWLQYWLDKQLKKIEH